MPRDPIAVPSGAIYGHERISIVRGLGRIGVIQWTDDPITLKSGRKSHVYVHGRNELTENPLIFRTVAALTALVIAEYRQTHQLTKPACLIGIPAAGTPLAILAASYAELASRQMRSVRKTTHGVHSRWIDGDPSSEYSYFTIDNVITDGGTKRETFEKLAEDGYDPKDIVHVFMVDREQGGVEALEADGYKTLTVFKLLDIAHVLGEVGDWTQERVQAVRDEIAAHHL